MAIRYSWRILKQDLSSADLTLSADAYEGFEIYNIAVTGGASGSSITTYIGEEVMCSIPTGSGEIELLPLPRDQTNQFWFLPYIRERYPSVPTFKVGKSETFRISNGNVAGTAYIYYKHLEADQAPDPASPGGSASTTRLFVSHGKYEATIAANTTVEVQVTTGLNPIPLSKFPFEGSVPSGTKFSLLGFAIDPGPSNATDVKCLGVRFWKLEEAILVKDQGWAPPELFHYPINTKTYPLFLFPEPIVFNPEETLPVELKIQNTNTTTDLTGQFFITFIFLKEPAG